MVDRRGETNLVRLSSRGPQATTLATLTLNGNVWDNGLQSLVLGQLLAFGAPRYETPNRLYSIAPVSGAMSELHRP